MRGVGLTLTLLASIFLGRSAPAEDLEGLPAGPGQEEVFYACGACHSTYMVQQQRLSRRVWDELLDWMVAKQGMAELEPAERALVLDYLERHFGRPS
jgi:hypothetical protein